MRGRGRQGHREAGRARGSVEGRGMERQAKTGAGARTMRGGQEQGHPSVELGKCLWLWQLYCSQQLKTVAVQCCCILTRHIVASVNSAAVGACSCPSCHYGVCF